jgi:hypothetical protein
MWFPALAAKSARRIFPLLVAVLFLIVVTGPVAAPAAAAPSTTGQTSVFPTTTTVLPAGGSAQPGQAGASSSTTAGGSPTTTAGGSPTTAGAPAGPTAQPDSAGVIPPPTGQVPLNPGWKSDQVEVRVWPEYDEKAVLVILNFSLPADVPLPATVKFATPAGAIVTGIGEIGPNGAFNYSYQDSRPPVEPGTEWDITTIEVKNYRELQIDYYYDPGLPAGAGQRSFPLLVQTAVDAGTLLLHVQHPARSTDMSVQPALQGSGQADDGFTYSVAAYPDIQAGSTLGLTVSYNKPDGGLSIDQQPSDAAPAQVNTNTVLLVAILAIVLFIGAIVIWRLFFGTGKAGQRRGRQGAVRSMAATAPAGANRQRGVTAGSASASTRPNGMTKTSMGKATGAKSAAPKGRGNPSTATPSAAAATTADAAGSGMGPVAATVEAGSAGIAERGQADEYCVACGEELVPNSRFCPNCGEARS